MSLPNAPQTLRAAADAILELHEDGRLTEALAACDQLLERAVELGDPVTRESAFTAWYERAVLLAEVGELDASASAALAASDALPFDRHDPDQTHELAMLLVHAGTCLGALGAPEDALAVYDRLVSELEDADDPVTRGQVVRGQVNRAATLLALERHREALDVATALARELGGAVTGDDAEQLGMTQRIRAAALRGLGRAEAAVVALAEAEMLAGVTEVGARSQAAAAQCERARLLAELGRGDEAIALLERTVPRFTDDPAVSDAVAELRLLEAELLDAAGHHDRAAELRAAVGQVTA
ncbi:MAG: hypothetical protein WEB09_02715 [Nitriliruptor sp.]